MKKMNKYYYFKVTFIFVFVALFVANAIKGLFDIGFSNIDELIKMVLKSFVISILTGLILGLLNMFFKVNIFNKK